MSVPKDRMVGKERGSDSCPNENKYGMCFENCCLPESKEKEND